MPCPTTDDSRPNKSFCRSRISVSAAGKCLRPAKNKDGPEDKQAGQRAEEEEVEAERVAFAPPCAFLQEDDYFVERRGERQGQRESEGAQQMLDRPESCPREKA